MLLMLGCNGLFAQSDSTEKFVFLEYGFANSDECFSIKYTIGEKWSIDYKRVANCMVSSELVDSVRIFNLNTSERLSEKYGADWEERYQHEIDDACEKRMIIVNQSKIDTITRESAEFSERIINSPDFDVLEVEITPKEGTKKEYQPPTIRNLQDESNNILYLGFPNTFEIDLPRPLSSTYTMECINCEIKTTRLSDSLTTGQYTIRAKRRKETFLNIYAQDELIASNSFDVHLLPDPEIHINNIPNGGDFPIELFDSTLTIEVRYADSITLRSTFQVELWELGIVGKPVLIGSGARVHKERIGWFKSQSPEDKLRLLCNVRCPDGTLREKAAIFVLK